MPVTCQAVYCQVARGLFLDQPDLILRRSEIVEMSNAEEKKVAVQEEEDDDEPDEWFVLA